MRTKLKQIYYRIISAKAEPWQIAGGVAVGLFWGFSPFWGLQMFFAAICATLLNVSRIPAVILVHLSNPITAPALYPITWRIGDWILSPFVRPAPMASGEFVLSNMLTVAWGAILRMTVGGMFIGMLSGVIGYFITLVTVKRFQQTLRNRSKTSAKNTADAAGARPADAVKAQDDPPAAGTTRDRIGSSGQPGLQNSIHRAS